MTDQPAGAPGLPPEILAHYERTQERDRLSAGPGRLEFARTQEILRRWLPPPPAIVLDVGGGAGVHALPLAARGYAVHLFDPVPRHVDQAAAASARQAAGPLAGAALADARRLPFPSAGAAAVLMLGPLYHLTVREDRLAAIAEARRALSPGGLLLAAAISRFASTLDGLARHLLDDPDFERIAADDRATGQHRNPTGNPEYFTTAFFHHPDGLREEVATAGLAVETVLAIEGPAWMLHDLEARWDDAGRRRRLLEAVRAIEAEPSLLGASAHLMVVARRR